MIRELVSRFSRSITERRASPRRKHAVPIKVSFAPEKNYANLTGPSDESFLSGETVDVSETGIGFTVAVVRIKERYLVGQDRILNVELDVHGRKVRMQVKGVRYEKVGIHLSAEKYLIGAVITDISDEDRRSYEYLLKHGGKFAAAPAPALGLGVE